MATYNITMVGNNLKVDRVVTSNNFRPKSDLYKSPSFVQSVDSIIFREDGSRKQTLRFEHFGTIGGVAPTSLSDAMDKLSILIDGV